MGWWTYHVRVPTCLVGTVSAAVFAEAIMVRITVDYMQITYKHLRKNFWCLDKLTNVELGKIFNITRRRMNLNRSEMPIQNVQSPKSASYSIQSLYMERTERFQFVSPETNP